MRATQRARLGHRRTHCAGAKRKRSETQSHTLPTTHPPSHHPNPQHTSHKQCAQPARAHLRCRCRGCHTWRRGAHLRLLPLLGPHAMSITCPTCVDLRCTRWGGGGGEWWHKTRGCAARRVCSEAARDARGAACAAGPPPHAPCWRATKPLKSVSAWV
eukprot:332371-Prymnesium_polylepis.2